MGIRAPFIRVLALTTAFFALGLAALGAAWGWWFLYGTPTAEDYLAHAGPQAALVPAGALAFDGRRFVCGRYPTVLNDRLDDYGAAYFGFVIVNPARFRTLPATVRRYAYGHECGHQYVGYDEVAADCFAVRRGRREGWLDARALDEICAFISRSRGDGRHLPGAKRCALMRRCHARARPGQEPH